MSTINPYLLCLQFQRKLEFEVESKRKLEMVIKERERQLDNEIARNRDAETNKMNINERVVALEKMVRHNYYPFVQ